MKHLETDRQSIRDSSQSTDPGMCSCRLPLTRDLFPGSRGILPTWEGGKQRNIWNKVVRLEIWSWKNEVGSQKYDEHNVQRFVWIRNGKMNPQ